MNIAEPVAGKVSKSLRFFNLGSDSAIPEFRRTLKGASANLHVIASDHVQYADKVAAIVFGGDHAAIY